MLSLSLFCFRSAFMCLSPLSLLFLFLSFLSSHQPSNLSVDGFHCVIVARIRSAYVRSDYWNGKQFIGRDASVPPYLTFLGSQRFAYVVPEASHDQVS